jgi:hypothetical protein
MCVCVVSSWVHKCLFQWQPCLVRTSKLVNSLKYHINNVSNYGHIFSRLISWGMYFRHASEKQPIEFAAFLDPV